MSSSSTNNGSNGHPAITTTTGDVNTGEIPTILGYPWISRTFNPFDSNVVPTFHQSSYPAINPSLNPAILQTGKTVLVTGATAGIGLAMAKSFVAASASKVIITGRRKERLDKAVETLRQHAKETGNEQAEVVGEISDAAKMEDIDALWMKLGDEGQVVDVLVLNAVAGLGVGPFCQEGGRTSDDIWRTLETNVRGPMRSTELFMKQGKDKQKFLINISSNATHISKDVYSPALATGAEYGFTKTAAGLFFQYVAEQSDPEKLQVVSFHPGAIYSEIWQGMGVEKSAIPFDDVSLPADFAVWAATKEARFIHGRYVWAHWDVEEMKAAYAERLEKDFELFRYGVCGLAGSNLHFTP